jgi:HK97 family phage major capsid protein
MGVENLEELEKKALEIETRLKEVEKKEKELEEQRKANLTAMPNQPIVGGGGSDSVEHKALRYFGAKDPGALIKINTGHPKYNWVPQEVKGYVRQFKEAVDVSRNLQQMFNEEPRDRNEEKPATVKGMLDGTAYAKDVLAPMVKAFGTGVSGGGQEWVPTGMSSQFVEEFELDREVIQSNPRINMPTNPFDLPVQSGVTVARIQAENTALADTSYTTSKLTFNATKFGEFMILPEELNEDSAVDILGLSRKEVVEAQGRAVETAAINGDNDGTHQDADTDAGSATLAEKAWNGYRKLALANSATQSFGNAAISLPNCRLMRTQMGKFGVNPKMLMWLVSAKGWNQMLNIPEVTTMEKFGPQATILAGALATLDGIPIKISEFMRDDLNDSGVEDGITTDRSGLLLVNHRRFYYGIRRPIRTKVVMDLPSQDRWLLASWARSDFQGHVQSADEVSVVYGINVA